METPQNLSGKARYSLRWAWQRVEELYSKYPRATDIVCDAFDISLKTLALYLAKGDSFYPYVRSRVHYVDRYLSRGMKDLTNVEYIRWFRSILSLETPAGLRERLDKRLNQTYAQRAGFQGGDSPTGAKAKGGESSLQLLLFQEEAHG